jgi:hypothetical protein
MAVPAVSQPFGVGGMRVGDGPREAIFIRDTDCDPVAIWISKILSQSVDVVLLPHQAIIHD